MSQLVQITKAPPLSQSRIERLACPRSYAALTIEGLESPASLASDRGTEIHKVAADYTAHCVKAKVSADWITFDRLAAKVGAEAAAILEGVRDIYAVDFENTVAWEHTFWLDDDFQP